LINKPCNSHGFVSFLIIINLLIEKEKNRLFYNIYLHSLYDKDYKKEQHICHFKNYSKEKLD